MKKVILYLSLAFLFHACSFSIGEKAGITFCSSCSKDLECEDESSKFSPGTVFLRLKVNDNFDSDSLNVALYYIKDGEEQFIDDRTDPIDPEWNTFCKNLTAQTPGKYKVIIKDAEGNTIDEGSFEIE